MKLRFSTAVTVLIVGVLGLAETTLQMFPETIPWSAARFFVSGLLPLLVAFLYQEEGVVPVVEQGGLVNGPRQN